MDNNSIVTYPIFSNYQRIKVFTTSKRTLENPVPRYTGDSAEEYIRTRKQLAMQLGIDPEIMVFPRQTHSTQIVSLNKLPESELRNTDALITNVQGICLCIQTADCVPLLLYDHENHAIAAIHAGWRGTVGKIASKTLQTMVNSFGTKPGSVRAAIGPSIGPNVYEVGDEVVENVLRNFGSESNILHKPLNSKFHFNLWEANLQLLISGGVPREHIYMLGECTFENRDKYFSARRDGVSSGRMATGIMLL